MSLSASFVSLCLPACLLFLTLLGESASLGEPIGQSFALSLGRLETNRLAIKHHAVALHLCAWSFIMPTEADPWALPWSFRPSRAVFGARLAPPRGEPGGTQPIIYSIWVGPTWLSLGGARWDPPVRLLIRLPVCGGARLTPSPSFAAAGPPSAASGRGGVSRGRWGMATVWISCSTPKI